MMLIVAPLLLLSCASAKPKAKSKTKPKIAEVAPLVKVEGELLQDEEYKCARCRFAAQMIRRALSSKNLPKKAKDAAMRRGLVEIVFAESDDIEDNAGVCARSKFPKEVKEKQTRKTMRITYVDAEEAKEGGIRYREISQGMEGVIDKLAESCELIVTAVKEEAAQRAFEFTNKVDKFTVGRAYTDRWVCYRATGLCPKIDFPEVDEDEDEDVNDDVEDSDEDEL